MKNNVSKEFEGLGGVRRLALRGKALTGRVWNPAPTKNQRGAKIRAGAEPYAFAVIQQIASAIAGVIPGPYW